MTQPPSARPEGVAPPVRSDPGSDPGRHPAGVPAGGPPFDIHDAAASNVTRELPRRVPDPGPSTAVLPVVAAAPFGSATEAPTPSPRTASGSSATAAPAVFGAPGVASTVRRGAGLPGFLAVAGLGGLGVSLFALPVEGRRDPIFFHDLRSAAVRPGFASADSLAGRPVATLWWRYGALIGFGALALFVALMVSAAALRRVSAALLVVAAFAVGTLLAYGGYQTADLAKQQATNRFVRESVHHFQLGFWIALACCAVLAVAALAAVSQRRR